jgi:hypothetical protein
MPMAIAFAVAVLMGRRLRCPHGAVTADVMMTMAGERGGEATARRRRGDGKATARRRRGNGEAMARRLQDNDEATRMRRQSAMAPQVAGATRQLTSG